MARLTSLIKVKGKLDGVSFYETTDGMVARMAKGPSKKRIAKDPAFARTRENNSEFGGSAVIAKALRTGLSSIYNKVSDKRTNPRLVKVIQSIIVRDTTGTRGMRPFNPLSFKTELEGFEFNNGALFSSLCNADYTLVSTPARNQATLTIADFNAANQINAPQGSTHFRIVCAITVLSSFKKTLGQKQYESDDPANGKNDLKTTAYFEINQQVSGLLPLISTLPAGAALLPDSALVACLGIEFHQDIGGSKYQLSAGNALQIIQLF